MNTVRMIPSWKNSSLRYTIVLLLMMICWSLVVTAEALSSRTTVTITRSGLAFSFPSTAITRRRRRIQDITTTQQHRTHRLLLWRTSLDNTLQNQQQEVGVLRSASSSSFFGEGEQQQDKDEEIAVDDRDLQWSLFQKYHAKGSWKGIWTTYDYMGDVMDETIASVDLIPNDNDKDVVTHLHQIVVGAKKSDCETCFDSMDVKTLPVATYTPSNLLGPNTGTGTDGRQQQLPPRARLGACGMVMGPTLLRKTGAMATELILSYGDGRVRCIFQHAPVWEQRNDPNSGSPPDGLKLFRTLISKEALRSSPPTVATESVSLSSSDATTTTTGPNNPIFSRPVSPFAWHKQWSGTAWTWGPTTGNRGWELQILQEEDAWHGLAPVNVWNLRLPIGGIFVQAPRIITGTSIGLCRLAWLPTDQTLLRLEAGVRAFEPVMTGSDKDDDDDDEQFIRFYPPSLASYRCDILANQGDLDGEPQFVRNDRDASSQSLANNGNDSPTPLSSDDKMTQTEASTPQSSKTKPMTETTTPNISNETATVETTQDDFDNLHDARDALQL